MIQPIRMVSGVPTFSYLPHRTGELQAINIIVLAAISIIPASSDPPSVQIKIPAVSINDPIIMWMSLIFVSPQCRYIRS